MDKYSFETLSEAVNTLTQKEGYKEDFEADENCIKALYSKKEYQPKDLVIINSYRFEGMTNPADESTVFTIEATDGTKGTLVMSYGAATAQNEDLIRQIPLKKD
ncbi:MAG: phosphoribosylpyrophosphate synthetase [Bacteroidota bacterium]|uniref:Phosphoribosylpyrophosphate synthetase n=1 Tax=Flagellimonas okinawensis TaxID=3031324 RepID=A0ABT5XQ82_9FLAO|nr:phosphoribosylpyrophosphate synthetase [[Muricauda] okinawensis]MDF0708055.1 phosphoribosylpyrophosphate synthetase [[Muricauda] okinawensis]MEC8831125.1 phosphoribosylpyrophosphate synthetase [Bacteroidota bacterium]